MPATGEARRQAGIRHRARLRGEDVPLRVRPWTPEEEELLAAEYSRNAGLRTGWLSRLSRHLQRDAGNLSRKARQLGLKTDYHRGRPRKPRQLRLHLPRGGSSSDRSGFWQVAGREHPRGMLGKHHSEAAKMKMSQSRRGRPLPPRTEAFKAALSRARAELLRMRPELFQRPNRGVGGRRADLGNTYFRSRWEANYARFLNFQKRAWKYEPKTFMFEGIQRGTCSYTPDFWLPDEEAYHEVKGWMDPKSATKLRRMGEYYPDVRVIVIGKDWFGDAERNGLCGVVPGWECRHNDRRQ